MKPEMWLMVGVALGAVPSAMLGRVAVAALAKRLGISPREIGSYTEAADGDGDGS